MNPIKQDMLATAAIGAFGLVVIVIMAACNAAIWLLIRFSYGLTGVSLVLVLSLVFLVSLIGIYIAVMAVLIVIALLIRNAPFGTKQSRDKWLHSYGTALRAFVLSRPIGKLLEEV